MEQNQKLSGAGSIWNVNSWHWYSLYSLLTTRESKNYTDTVKKILLQKFQDHKFTKEDLKFTFSKVKKLEGEVNTVLSSHFNPFFRSKKLGIVEYPKGKTDPLLRIRL